MQLDDERLDAAIDEAARRMTGAGPGPDFRRRVMARLDRTRTRPVWGLALAGFSAAAAIAIAIVLLRHPSPAPPRDVPLAGNAPAARPTEPPIVSPNREILIALDATSARRRIATPTGRDQAQMPADSELDPLTPAPIEVESIAVTDFAPQDPIAVQPLQPVAPIAVTPLGTDDQGDRR